MQLAEMLTRTTLRVTGLLVAALANAAYAQPLKARDIDGFRLGMGVREVVALAGVPVTDIGNGEGQFSRNGDKYEVAFTRRGRLYRIERDRPLGRFTPTPRLGRELSQKLTQKYGVPPFNQLPGGPASWGTNEVVVTSQGQRASWPAESLTVMITGVPGISEMGLSMKLIDMHLLREDAQTLNQAPEAKAQRRLTF